MIANVLQSELDEPFRDIKGYRLSGAVTSYVMSYKGIEFRRSLDITVTKNGYYAWTVDGTVVMNNEVAERIEEKFNREIAGRVIPLEKVKTF